MNDNFEQRLSQQPFRPVPTEWREEILAATRAVRAFRHSSLDTHHSWPSTLVARLSTFFWPSPVAWAGLAAIWILILAVDFSVRDKTSVLAEKFSPPTPEMIAELRQQQRMLAELIGPRDVRDADRSKPIAPRPRSERAEFLAV